MTSKIRAVMAAVCAAAAVACAMAQSNTGSLRGEVRDPSGAVVARAHVELQGAGQVWTRESGREGRFEFVSIPAGVYAATVTAPGFAAATMRNVVVEAGRATAMNLTLRVATARTEIEVRGEENAARRKVSASELARRRNLGEMAAEEPGVNLRENGALDGSPVLHGLGDERVKVVANGTTEENSCPNHMNPLISEAATAHATAVTATAGITPVSMGGDSLGGTVTIEEKAPVFAGDRERAYAQGEAQGYYRSNGEEYGGQASAWAATKHLAMGATSAWRTVGDYSDGNGHKVTSTYAQSSEETLSVAAQTAKDLLTAEAEFVHTPYEGFVNAQMDMVRNESERVNLHYRRTLASGNVEARAYWRGTWHAMNVGRDKLTFPMPMWMPMNTHGREMGYTVRVELPLGARHTLRAGNELCRFRLDDIWPPVAGTSPYMAPNAFVNVNDGRRARLGTFAEAVSHWNAAWTTTVGLRNDTVWSNAGAVSGYSSMYASDAAAFNAEQRGRRDADWDATVAARWIPNAAWTVDFGYARKSRAPSLYERYAWSKSWMASGMIGWFGDGNYYVGNVALKPETAHTASSAVRWMGRGARLWELKAAPFVTEVEDYVDVNTLATTMYGMSTFAQLQFANHSARIYGGDVSGHAELWDTVRGGTGTLSGKAGWLHGERTGSATPLYQMMPMNLQLNFDEEIHGFAGGAGMEAVDRKRNVDPNRYEQTTPGYTLFDLHARYRLRNFEASGGVENLLNKCYEPPLGGVNMDDFMAGMWMGTIKPVTGRGRSAYFSLSARF